MLRALGAAWSSITCYYLGSTAGGQKKSELPIKNKP